MIRTLAIAVRLVLGLCTLAANDAMASASWDRLTRSEAALAQEMGRVDTLLGYLDLADRIAVMQGRLSAADADARLRAYGQQVFRTPIAEPHLAEARARLGNEIAGYLDATARAAASSTRWPGGGATQAKAQRILEAVRSSYPRWLQNNLDPAVLLTQVELVAGWARGESAVANPFGGHLQRIQAAYPDARARARIASGAAPLVALDGKPVAATPAARPSPGATAGARPIPGEMGGARPGVVAPVVPPVGTTMRPPPGCRGFAGTWDSDFGPIPFTVQGNQARGTYTRPGGTIEASVNGDVLEGRWIQRDRSGLMRLVLSADGRYFNGRWTEANGSGGGAWNGVCSGAPTTAVSDGAPTTAARGGALEIDIDRPGLDVKSFDLQHPDPNQCMAACQGHGGCRAFTYVKPGVQGPLARCWLKSAVPAAVRSSCCISGRL